MEHDKVLDDMEAKNKELEKLLEEERTLRKEA